MADRLREKDERLQLRAELQQKETQLQQKEEELQQRNADISSLRRQLQVCIIIILYTFNNIYIFFCFIMYQTMQESLERARLQSGADWSTGLRPRIQV